jgi:hypothetical protein
MEFSAVPGYTRALQRGYRLEDSFREFSYLDAPEFICGVEVGPLTLQAYLQLCAARSPFLVGGRHPFIQDVAVFLFRLSPAFAQAHAAKEEARTKVATAATLPYRELLRIARENDLLPRFSILHPRSAILAQTRSALIRLLEQNVEAIAESAFTRARRPFIELILFFDFEEGFRRAVRSIDRFLDRMLLDQPPWSKSKNPSLDPRDTCFATEVIHMLASAYGWSRDEILALPMPEVFQTIRKIQRDDPRCPERYLAKVHPLANRFTRRHRAIARKAARAAAGFELFDYLASHPERSEAQSKDPVEEPATS